MAILRILGWLGAFGVIVAAWPASADPPPSPSFDCSRAASAIDKAICADRDLPARDATMAKLFALVRTDALGVGPSGEFAAQRKWLAQRDKDCAAKADVAACLRFDYDQRLRELAVAALVRAPEPAFAELKRQKLPTVPLYDAIYLMATQPPSDARTKTVEALIGPAFDAVKADKPIMLGDDIKTAHDAAASFKSFDYFIDLAGVVDDLHLTMPCEAIVRQPALIHALDSMFGSSMDNDLGDADCDAMLPPPPKFAALAADAADAATSNPDCTGTIRFAGLRDYSEFLIAVQLGRQGTPPKPSRETASQSVAFQRAHAAEVRAAVADLAAYYAREPHAPAAGADATRAVREVVDAAFGVCDFDQ